MMRDKYPLDIRGNSLKAENAALLSVGRYTDTKLYYISILDEVKRPAFEKGLHKYNFSYRIIREGFRTFEEATAVIHEMIEKGSIE